MTVRMINYGCPKAHQALLLAKVMVELHVKIGCSNWKDEYLMSQKKEYDCQ